ncbi:MAG TPA: DUF4278 domain-containing protein [Crinalium sp.]|jgi:hypothetical protein
MRLVYRGVGYDYEPTPTDMVESGVKGQYRGQTVDFKYPRHVPAPQPVLGLKYRGASYQTTSAGTASTNDLEAVKPVKRAATPVTVPAHMRPGQLHPAFLNRQAMMNEVSNTHRQNIQRRLAHRLEVAKAKGDQFLVNQLEREMQLIAY